MLQRPKYYVDSKKHKKQTSVLVKARFDYYYYCVAAACVVCYIIDPVGKLCSI